MIKAQIQRAWQDATAEWVDAQAEAFYRNCIMEMERTLDAMRHELDRIDHVVQEAAQSADEFNAP